MSNTLFPHASGFTSIDNDLFYIQSAVSASAFSLLIRVYRATQGYGVAVKALSGSYLQKTTNLSKNTVTKAIKELEDLGVLLVKRRARLSSYYQVSVKGVAKVCKEVKETLEDTMQTLSLELDDEEVAEDNFDTPIVDKEVLVVPDTGFDIFWSVYDKKLSKSDCKAVWNKLTATDHKNIMDTLEGYIEITPEKQYRKDPINYLKGRVWEDEVVARTPSITPANNKTQQPPNFSAPVQVERDVVKVGTVADSKINDFLSSYGRKGSTYA